MLIAANQLDLARERIAIALDLAEETDAKFYHAELLRLRAQTAEDDDRAADLAQAIDVAKKQRALYSSYVLRSTISICAAARRDRCSSTLVNHFADDSAWPELAPRSDAARVKRPGGKVVILGGGMAGLAAAWRLSEPGWRDRFDSITVYQRGWRLGGKGASSRGENGRIEEHGLHIWLGSYENAFGVAARVLRRTRPADNGSGLHPSRPGMRLWFPVTISDWPTSWAAIG